MKLVTKVLISLVVVGITCGFLMATNMWDPSVVSLTRHVAGDRAAEQLDTSARSGVQAGKDWVDEARNMDLDDLITKAKDLPVPEMRRTPKYDREPQFGTWILQDNGCNTRQMILSRDLDKVKFADDKCTVLSGALNPDPYTGKKIVFAHDRIGGDSQAVQIDHIVPLSVAWKMGAHKWSQDQRIAFANDPVNLLASDGPANNGKGDKTPDRWMVPQNTSYQCTYAQQYTNVSVKYGLSMDKQVSKRLLETLEQC